jgi:hypothetical protein
MDALYNIHKNFAGAGFLYGRIRHEPGHDMDIILLKR